MSQDIKVGRLPWFKRSLVWGVGLFGNFLFVKAFDYVLYPAVIYFYGVVLGSAVMTIVSFLVCWLTIIAYDWSKQDWILIETFKGIREDEAPPNKMARTMQWLLRKGDWVALVVLSIKFDPFITAMYLRRGAFLFNGLSKRDWKIFLASTVISNAYWTLAVFMGITLVEMLLSWMRSGG